jgi:RNA polymerase sigma factor (sigma-70 family)
LAAVPSIGRANRIEGVAPAEAELTRALYEQYAHQIFRYCLHQLGSREEAEDAVQSTFLNAFRGIKRGIVPELESAWLFKIAHNVCLSRRRSSWRRGRVESPADFELVEELTPAPSRRSDELIGLQDVLEEMPENQRRAILLREWQGLSYREIAEELELSQAAVETLIFRARRTLASGLERPPERRKVARLADWGNVFAAFKALVVGGSAAAKVAATVAVVSATTVAAADPVQHYRAQHHATPAPSAPAPAPVRSVPRPAAHAAVGTSASLAAPAVHARRQPPAPVVHRRAHVAKAVAPVATAKPATAPPPAPVEQAPAQSAPPVVQQAPASTPSEDKQAAKNEKRAAKAEKHASKGGKHGSNDAPPAASQPDQSQSSQSQPTQPQPANTQPTGSGTNPAGKEKEHGRWARAQQVAPALPVATPAPTPSDVAAPTPAPTDQVEPIAAPDPDHPGKGNGKDK